MSSSLPPPTSDPIPASPGTQWRPPTGPPHDGRQLPPPVAGTQPTVLLDEPPAPRSGPRRSRHLPAILLISGVLLLGALFVADWVARNIEMNNLLTQIEKSEDAMGAAQESLRALRGPGAGGGDAQTRTDAIEKASAAGRDAVAAAGREVAAASFLPWHGSLIEAQSVYLQHNDAWVRYLDAGSRSATALGNSPLDIETTWHMAEVVVRDAVPFVPFPGINARVDAIFEDSDEGSSGPTIEA